MKESSVRLMPFGVPINILLLSSMLFIQLTAIVLIIKNKRPKEM